MQNSYQSSDRQSSEFGQNKYYVYHPAALHRSMKEINTGGKKESQLDATITVYS
jgi:hypothetical protein